jgi:glycosyltransferase involved in cell wall biosynthesis
MTPPAPQLSVVMPLYNEAARIAANVEQTVGVLRMLGPFELILVDDGSVDDSARQIARLAERFPGEVIPLALAHAGKGEALRRGAQQARGEFVVFIDADLDLPPEQILFFVAIQRVKKADAVIGSKMHPDSTVDYPLRRRIYSLGYFWLVKALFGLPVRDTQTGLKLVRRELLLRALEQTQSQGFTLDLELLVRLVQLGAVMVEAPVVVQHSMKFGGIGLGTVWAIFHDTFRTWQRVRRTGTEKSKSHPKPHGTN